MPTKEKLKSLKILRAVFAGALAAALVLTFIFAIGDVTAFDAATRLYESDLAEYEKIADENREALSVDEGENIVYIDVIGFGLIAVELRPDVAPITVANFKSLVKEGFYDGLTFHRIMEGFMIQGGDPKGDGTGGSGKEIKGEFSKNGVENNLLHTEGVISMARGEDYNSASSQFFIVHQTSQNNSYSLDGNYAAFGKVVVGMDVVDAIAKVPTNSYNHRPLETVRIRTVTQDKSVVENPERPTEPVKPIAADFFMATIVTSVITVVMLGALIVSILLVKSKKAKLAALAEEQRLADLARRKEEARQRQIANKKKKK